MSFTAYPPGDPKVTEFLWRGNGQDNCVNHALAAALLAGTLKHGTLRAQLRA